MCQLTGANRKVTEKLIYGAGIQASRKATRVLSCGRRQQAVEKLVSCPMWPSCASGHHHPQVRSQAPFSREVRGLNLLVGNGKVDDHVIKAGSRMGDGCPSACC